VKKQNTHTAHKVQKTSVKRKSIISTKKRNISKRSLIQYVLPIGNGWVVKANNTSRFTVVTDSKREAIVIARNRAKTKHSELIVHGKKGNIELRESYVV